MYALPFDFNLTYRNPQFLIVTERSVKKSYSPVIVGHCFSQYGIVSTVTAIFVAIGLKKLKTKTIYLALLKTRGAA